MFFPKIFSLSAILVILLSADYTHAESGWMPEEPIAFATIDPRFSGALFDNKSNRLISYWDGDGNVGGGFSTRPHLGLSSFRSGPSNGEYLTFSVDPQGNALVGYITAAGKVSAGLLIAGAGFITNIQDLGATVPYNAGRTVDIHITKNGLGAIIWLDNQGRPNVAFRGSSIDAEFDISNKVILDGSPSSSAGNVFIARDLDGGAFAMWRKDNQWKQAYFDPSTGIFNVQNFNLAVPIGDPPAPGKVNSGSVFSLEINKNSSGDCAIAYGIYTSVKGSSVAPFNSISVAYAYRKRSTQQFGPQSISINPDDIEELYTQVAVLPDGRAIISWLRKQLIPNTCTSGISGPYISGPQEFRSIISDTNGSSWQGLYSMAVNHNTTFISFPTEIAVANGRVVFGIKKNFKATLCSTSTTSSEFNLINALWPSDKPAFTSVGSAITVPGLNGFLQGGTLPYFGDLASIAVSDIGTIAVLAAKRPPTSFDETPSVFVWESGLEPGDSEVNPETGPGSEPTPSVEDFCSSDQNKTTPGICGCGFEEIDSNGDTIVDCGSPGIIYTKGAILTNAPKVESNGKNLSLIMQIYDQIVSGAVPAKKGGKGSSKGGNSKKITATYEVTANLQNSKVKCRKIRIESSKNTVQLKNLLNGTYDVSYRMIFRQGKKKIGASSQSPIATGTITQGKNKCRPPKKKSSSRR